jgi:hypothetical protein
MLDAIGTMFVGLSMAVILTAVLTTMPLRLSARLVLAGAAGAWAGVAAAAAGSGSLTQPMTLPALFAAPLILTGLIAVTVPAARRAVSAIPLRVLEGLNIFRLGGVLFVLLALAGRLSGPFPYIAGPGDILTGALAVPIVWSRVKKRPVHDRWVFAWNAFGMLDLVVAVALGVISMSGSPLQLIHAGVGTAALRTLPWALVPTVLVPFFLISHSIIFVRLRGRRTKSVGHGPDTIGSLSHAQ